MRSIAVLSNLYSPLVTGSSVHASTLAAKLVERGVSVTVFTAHVDKSAPEHEFLNGVEVYRLPCLRLPKLPIAVNFPWLSVTMLPQNIFRMKKIMREKGCQLIHVHNHMFDMALNGVLLKWILDIPLVLSIHSYIHHPNPVFNAILSSIDATFLRWCMVQRATHIVDLDMNNARYRVARFGARRGTLIPLATEFPEPPSPQDVEMLRKRYDLEGRKVLLSVGHLHHLRNRLALIRGFARALRKFPEARLLIVGARNFQPAEDLVAELGLDDKVIFTDKQPRHLVAAFMELCDAHSMWFDLDPNGQNSVGNSNIEAMLMKKPVFGVFAEDTYGEGVLQHGRNIFILPPEDTDRHVEETLLKLWGDPGLAGRIGENAQRTAREHLSWDVAADRHLQLFDSLIAAGRR